MVLLCCWWWHHLNTIMSSPYTKENHMCRMKLVRCSQIATHTPILHERCSRSVKKGTSIVGGLHGELHIEHGNMQGMQHAWDASPPSGGARPCRGRWTPWLSARSAGWCPRESRTLPGTSCPRSGSPQCLFCRCRCLQPPSRKGSRMITSSQYLVKC